MIVAMDTGKGVLPATAKGHFVLHFYAAIFDLLRRIRAMAGQPDGFADLISEHPFLKGYIEEIAQALPGHDPLGTDPQAWAEAMRELEQRAGTRLPLATLRATGLDSRAIRLLMLVGLAEEDSRFGDLFAWLQVGTGHRRPTLGFAETILGAAVPEDESAWRQLDARGLIRPPGGDAPRSEQILMVPQELWSVIRGEAGLWPPVGSLAPEATQPPGALIFPPEVQDRLTEAARLFSGPGPVTLVLRGDTGLDLAAIAAALLAPGGRRTVMIRGEPEAEGLRQLGAWCTLTACAPVFLLELGPGAVAQNLRPRGYPGPVIAAPGPEGGVAVVDGETQVTLTLPPLGPELRREVWTSALGQEAAQTLGPVLDGLRVSEGYARRIAAGAQIEARLGGRRHPSPADINSAARALNHQLLDGLADRMDSTRDWSALIAAPPTMAMLRVLEDQARNRETLSGRMGPAFDGAAAQGVRALFTGVSGTGKTMCARLLAGALGKELYRVDLASVVNKYIGETEKNLGRVLSRAEALDVVLLLDEGDALLGTRTEVKSANDRYANLETNYLLQRLEHYRGIIVVTTNYGDNIDKAFQRRMDVVVTFYRPSADEREAILRMHLPADHGLRDETVSEAMSRCDLTGGQIRNVSVRAVLAAVSEGVVLQDRHLLQALAIEHDKAGAVFPLGAADRGPPGARGGARSLADALRSAR